MLHSFPLPLIVGTPKSAADALVGLFALGCLCKSKIDPRRSPPKFIQDSQFREN